MSRSKVNQKHAEEVAGNDIRGPDMGRGAPGSLWRNQQEATKSRRKLPRQVEAKNGLCVPLHWIRLQRLNSHGDWISHREFAADSLQVLSRLNQLHTKDLLNIKTALRYNVCWWSLSGIFWFDTWKIFTSNSLAFLDFLGNCYLRVEFLTV